MSITPLYELREQLEMGMIIGIEQISKNVRLKRAWGAFVPLESVSPVFEKIAHMARMAIAPDCPNRAGVLLDTVALIDAVLCAQGTVDVKGEMEPIKSTCGDAVMMNIPCSIFLKLLNALQNPGEGHYRFIINIHQQKPELFQDYRVREAMIVALKASYAELTAQIAKWLKAEGAAVIPFLKKGFDPKGKREMVQRVEIIGEVAGAEENAFYLSQLKTATKEVKLALIYALRYSQDNADKLMALTETEKGKAQNIAYWALSFCLDQDKVWHFWKEKFMGEQGYTIAYLTLSTADAAGKLVGKTLIQELSPFVEGKAEELFTEEKQDRISDLLISLYGKSGAEISQCYRLAVSLSKKLDKKEWMFYMFQKTNYYGECMTFCKAIPTVLEYSLVQNPTQELMDLAVELYEIYGIEYLSAALTAKIMSGSIKECCECLNSLLEKEVFSGKKEGTKVIQSIYESLCSIYWDSQRKCFIQNIFRYSPVHSHYDDVVVPLEQPLDEPFYDLLIQISDFELDTILIQWIQPDNGALCEKIGRYFYEKVLSLKTDQSYQLYQTYFQYMNKCEWNDCKGLMVHLCSIHCIYMEELPKIISKMPGDNHAKAKEVQQLLEKIEQGEINIQVLDAKKGEKIIQELRDVYITKKK